MLRGIRTASTNWLGKTIMAIVMGTLIVSFAIWGIGDIFRGFGRSSVAKIGRTEIGIEQFRQIYNERLQQIGRQIGRPISPDQARALGFDQPLLGHPVSYAATADRAADLARPGARGRLRPAIARQPGVGDRARRAGAPAQARGA